MSSYDPFNKPPRSGGGGGGGGPRRPSRDPMDELTRNFKNKGGSIFSMGLILTVIVGVMSSFYTVDAGHVGVVLRFGEHIETTGPGLHFKVPFGVDTVEDVAVERQQKMEFGFRTAAAGVQSTLRRDGETVAESDMLTGDLNVAKVEWIIQFVINIIGTSVMLISRISHQLLVVQMFSIEMLVTRVERLLRVNPLFKFRFKPI